uniref:CMP-sialic acid transporter n=1 Tax=Phaeomonas parva TaxID=124430 RepID=A0A7S1TRQ5_9STRA
MDFKSSTVVVVSEITKIFVAFLLLANERGESLTKTLEFVQSDTRAKFGEALKLMVPSTLYVIQNNLVLFAADNLDGPVLAVLSQVKILTTAIFSITMLKRVLVKRQWLALLVLALGVSAVQISQIAAKPDADAAGKRNPVIGAFAVLAACCTSGFAGVYFEMVLKGSEISVWMRNIHLAIIGTVISTFTVYLRDSEHVATHGFFYGYNAVVWCYVAVAAGGGLLVAAVVKYADNILKAFATSVGILLTSLLSYLFFDFNVNTLFLLGALFVVYSIFLYGNMLKDIRGVPGWLGGPGKVTRKPSGGFDQLDAQV